VSLDGSPEHRYEIELLDTRKFLARLRYVGRLEASGRYVTPGRNHQVRPVSSFLTRAPMRCLARWSVLLLIDFSARARS
jgi:hypothetical protein